MDCCKQVFKKQKTVLIKVLIRVFKSWTTEKKQRGWRGKSEKRKYKWQRWTALLWSEKCKSVRCIQRSQNWPRFSSVQSSHSVVSNSLRSHELQHARPPRSITNSRSSLKLASIESVMPSSHLILCRPLLLLPPIPPSIRVFSSESTLRMRWPSLERD